ncbi:MAG: hypothetical protein KAJ66_04730 [Candidatus Omnitrophica bacterium]|nr:hypothetical protein [Candidatus Omnitrophota bacterium]
MNSKIVVTFFTAFYLAISCSLFSQSLSEADANPSGLIAKISIPAENALVRAHVPIFGLAYGENFKEYKVEYGEGPDPRSWIEIITSETPQVQCIKVNEIAAGDHTIHGNLATWSTGFSNYIYGEPLADLNGIYTVRLVVFGKNGEIKEDRVTVEVGRVIPIIYGGKIESKDGRVVLRVPEQGISSSFKVFGIKAIVDENISIPAGYRLIGKIYIIRPQGERFIKDAALEMSYLESGINSSEEKKIAIYTYNPNSGRWDYLPTVNNIEKGALKTSISGISPGIGYYCILAKDRPPSAPLIYKSYSPTPLKLVTIKGEAEPDTKVEIFVNGICQDKVKADKATGIFECGRVLLNNGENIIFARAVDQFGQIGPPSDSIMCEVVTRSPIKIKYLRFMKKGFLKPQAGSRVCMGDKLYLELKGEDASPNTIDAVDIKLISGISHSKGIDVRLLETDYNSGIYRNIVTISRESLAREKKIGVGQSGETIYMLSEIDALKQDKIMFLDTVPPLSPTITSKTHPSLLQSTFEDGFSSWSSRDRNKGAVLSIDEFGNTKNGYCLKLTARSYRSNFSSTVISTPFDAKKYSLVIFDYSILPNVKINFLAKVKGIWYEVEFTDDPKKRDRLNIEKIGKIDNVIADGNWHTAQFNLYQMLREKIDAPIVEEFIMANWDEAGYMKLEHGRNKKGSSYFIDNFRISGLSFANSDVEFSFSAEDDISKELEYSFCFDHNPDTIPDILSEGAKNSFTYQDRPDGKWYFHVRAKDKAGNWGMPNHYRIIIDTKSPVVDLIAPVNDSRSFGDKIVFYLTDNKGSGIDSDAIKLKINGVEYDAADSALNYDRAAETLTFSPAAAGILFKNKKKVNIELVEASDFCGNLLKGPAVFSFVMDYSKNTIEPSPPKIHPLISYSGDKSLVSLFWEENKPLWIKGHSFLIDRCPQTQPDKIINSRKNSKIYKNLEPGTWYFHICCQDKAGNWSKTAHSKMPINNTKDKSILLVDDFDTGDIPNKLGGGFYYLTNPDAGGECAAVYHKEKKGYSLALRYEVPEPEDYTSYWTSLEGIDLRGYNSLNLWVREVKNNELARIGFRDSKGAEPKVKLGDYLTAERADGWQKVVIPLSSFAGISNWSKMERLSFSFENWMGMKRGTIYIDNIYLTKQVMPLIIDNFDDGKEPNFIGGYNYFFCDRIAEIQVGYYRDDKDGESGCCYRISYNGVKKKKRDGTPESYCGYIAVFDKPLNASIYNNLSFLIKGKVGNEKPNIYLDDGTSTGYVDTYVDLEKYVNVKTSWQKVNIPLIDFIKQGTDISRLTMFKMVFEWDDMEGTIFIDDIKFDTRL